MDITNLIGNVGVSTALLIVVLYWVRSWFNNIQRQAIERELRLGQRIDDLENAYRGIMQETIGANTAALKENYRSLRRMVNSNSDLTNAIRLRPCLTEDTFHPHPSIDATGDTTVTARNKRHHSTDALAEKRKKQ